MLAAFKKRLWLFGVLAAMIVLPACGGTDGDSSQGAANGNQPNQAAAKTLDLTGNWKQSNSHSQTSYQEAVIQGDTIEVYWVAEENDVKSLYWAGTYAAPGTSDKKYSWDSANDKSKTDSAMLASGDDTKTFSYEDGVLSYSVTALGTTQTVKLKKQ